MQCIGSCEHETISDRACPSIQPDHLVLTDHHIPAADDTAAADKTMLLNKIAVGVVIVMNMPGLRWPPVPGAKEFMITCGPNASLFTTNCVGISHARTDVADHLINNTNLDGECSHAMRGPRWWRGWRGSSLCKRIDVRKQDWGYCDSGAASTGERPIKAAGGGRGRAVA
jgi:hypothetical protein